MPTNRVLPRDPLHELVANFMSGFTDETAEAEEKLRTKSLDPIIFAIEFNAIGGNSWSDLAVAQAIRKTRENRIGAFHQNLFGLMPDWDVLPQAQGDPDLVCRPRKLVVELKSRRDTVKGSKLFDVYDDLLRSVTGTYRSYTGIFGHILNKTRSSMAVPVRFTPPVNSTGQSRPSDSRILRADGSLLWAIASQPDDELFGPYSRPDAIFTVYSEVFEAMKSIAGSRISDAAVAALIGLSRNNFEPPARRPRHSRVASVPPLII